MIPFKWFLFVSLISPVVELVDFPLPNHPVARRRLTARLLLFAKMPSSLVLLALLLLLLVLVAFDAFVLCTFDCSRRHLRRPRMRSIKFELVKRNNSSLFGSLFVVVVFCSKPVVVVSAPTVKLLAFVRFASSLLGSSGSTFAVMPSSSISNVRTTFGFEFFLFVDSVVDEFVAFAFRAGSSGNVIGVDDRFVVAFIPLPLAIDVFREFVFSNGDA